MRPWILNPCGTFSLDIETTGLSDECEIVSAAIAWREGATITSHAFWLDRYCRNSQDDRTVFQTFLYKSLLNPSYQGTAVFHNIGFDLRHLLRVFARGSDFSSKRICNVSDTLTISRVSRNNKYVSHIDPRRLSCHSLKFLAKEFLHVDHSSFEDVVNHGNIRLANQRMVIDYNKRDAEITLQLYELFQKTLDEREQSYLRTVETPHLLNLFHMNWNGVPYNAEEAKKWLQDCHEQIQILERQIHSTAGSTFNISSHQELISHLFFNPRINFRYENENHVLKPLFLTPTGLPKVDLDTLSEMIKRLQRPGYHADSCIGFLNSIMQFTELSKTVSFIESHLSYVQRENEGHRLFANFSAEAKSGRLKSSKPNLLGLPKKLYKKTNPILLSENDRKKSVRNLIQVKSEYEVWSIDINALDLTVVTQESKKFNPAFPLIELFEDRKSGIDIHMAISARMDRKRYADVLSPITHQLKHDVLDYMASKPGDEGVRFLHKKSNEIEFAKFPDDGGIVKSQIEKRRTLSKQINLSTAYMMGSKTLAQRLTEETGELYTALDANQLLNEFYRALPEIRKFQDEIANAIYQDGFVQSIFGRKYFADVFDELNQHYRESQKNGLRDQYELICKFNGKYWYIKADTWEKCSSPVVQNLKLVESPFGFRFDSITCIEQLDSYLFRKSRKKRSSLFHKKTEQQMDEMSNFELNRIALTNEIDRQLSSGTSVTSEADEILNTLIRDGAYFLSEKNILLYRVPLANPSAKYFRFYKGFMQVIRKFFPMYCQGVAATVASLCLTEIREEIESRDLDAQILLFVHDQIDVMVHKRHSRQVKELLVKCVESSKAPFDIPLSGKLEGPAPFLT